MSFLKRLFSKPKPAAPDQLVRLHIPIEGAVASLEEYQRIRDQFATVRDSLEAAVAKVGELDGDEYGEGEYTIWFYGTYAKPLAAAIREHSKQLVLPAGCSLFIRAGSVQDPNAPESIEPL